MKPLQNVLSQVEKFEILNKKEHLKRSSGLYFVSNYNPVLLKPWEVNLDIQPVHNYYKVFTYMTGYFSKSESEVSETLKLAARKIENQGLNVRDAMKKIAYS